MPKPVPYNVTFVQGDTYRLRLRFKDDAGDAIDITDWVFNAQVRANYDDTAVMGQFTYDIEDQTQAETKGYVTLVLTDDQTTDIPVAVLPDPSGYFDVEVTFPDGDVRTYVSGKVTAKAQVSRA